MTRAIRSELLKMRTARLSLALLAAAAALTAVVTILGAARAGAGHMAPAALGTLTGQTEVITRTWFGLIMALVFGVTVATGEYRHGTATGTYLATPHRARVLAAKTTAAAAAGLLFGLAAAALTTGITLAFVAAKGYHLALAAGTIARFAAGAVLGAGLLAAAGVGVGSLIRSQLAAILTVFAWGIVAEQVIGGLFTSIKPYLPYTAATTMAGSGAGGASPLPFAAAAALVAAVAALLAGVAARTTVRRDIT